MRAPVRAAVETALGARVERATPVAGGDINEAYRVDLADGRRVFVKANASASPAMFPAEARGLAWLDQSKALRVPRVLAVSDEDSPTAYLVLEHLEPGVPTQGFDEELGRGLAMLHRASAPTYGLDHDNFIGRLPQDNTPADSWATFYGERRLGAQLSLAVRQGRATTRMQRLFDRLLERLEDLVGAEEPPARLHGDLWGGNLHVSPQGAPCLIDPAVYGGHREIDLAMMRLFGGFGARVFAAYDEAHPLSEGHAERVDLYQLYPLMVHVNLFGGSYVGSVERILARYA
jgi:fructosamine-3-kinase